MMRRHFKTTGKLRATVTIDPDRELMEVRPYRSRRTYVWPLGDVAAMVVHRVTAVESGHAQDLKPAPGKRVKRGMLH